MRGLLILSSALVLVSANAHTARAADHWQFICQDIGNNQPEPLDKKDNAILAGAFSCRIAGGLMDGGSLTGVFNWEVTGDKAKMLSGMGIIRKEGAVVAYQDTSGENTFTVKDGNITGWSAKGTAVWLAASGPASAGLGKTFHWTAKPTGINQFTVDESE